MGLGPESPRERFTIGGTTVGLAESLPREIMLAERQGWAWMGPGRCSAEYLINNTPT